MFAGFGWVALGEGEAGGFEVMVDQVELHFAAFGDFEGFVEVALGGFVVFRYPVHLARARRPRGSSLPSSMCTA